jgi:hypothetical protein
MALSGAASVSGAFRLKENGRRVLVAEAGADCYALAADGAAAAQHGSTGLGLHARTETMGFHAFAAIGLKCALGHENRLLFPDENLRLDGKY